MGSRTFYCTGGNDNRLISEEMKIKQTAIGLVVPTSEMAIDVFHHIIVPGLLPSFKIVGVNSGSNSFFSDFKDQNIIIDMNTISNIQISSMQLLDLLVRSRHINCNIVILGDICPLKPRRFYPHLSQFPPLLQLANQIEYIF